MEISLIIFILCVHWFADFVLQNSYMAQGKSKRMVPLLVHTLVYSAVWYVALLTFFAITCTSNDTMPYLNILYFTIITFIAHTGTDYVTSRISASLWTKQNVHAFFICIGFDQVLHYVQLVLTFQLLFT